ARFATQYTPNTLAGLDTLDLMKVQLLREWNNSTLPIVHLNSPYILGLDDNVK
ncbi:o-succinylbenzoate synthase, partial [Glaesserella parasuis]